MGLFDKFKKNNDESREEAMPVISLVSPEKKNEERVVNDFNSFDEETGLSQAFLKRAEEEKKKKEEEERFNRPVPQNMSPIFDDSIEKVKVDVNSSKTFAEYDNHINKELLSDEASGRRIKLTDYDIAMGRGLDEKVAAVTPEIIKLDTENIGNNSNPMYDDTLEKQVKENPLAKGVDDINKNPILG